MAVAAVAAVVWRWWCGGGKIISGSVELRIGSRQGPSIIGNW